MSERDYTNEAQQRVMKITMALGGAMFHGLSNGELAKLLDTTPSNIVRDLWNMKKGGFVDQIAETGRWRLGVRPVQVYRAFTLEMQQLRTKADELEQRYTRLPD